MHYDYNLAWDRLSDLTVTHAAAGAADPNYHVGYDYDLPGRLRRVWSGYEPDDPNKIRILADPNYDLNGNRTQLTYWLDGTDTGSYYELVYSHSPDNFLTEIQSANGPTYHFDASQPTYIDGLGRLKLAGETVTKPDNTTVLQVSGHQYDRRSQLTTSQMQVGGSNVYYESYSYDKVGNLDKVTDLDAMPNVDTTYGYDGDVLDDYDGSAIGFDLNGQTTNTAAASSVDWNWDGMIREAVSGLTTIDLKYHPYGDRLWRQVSVSGGTTSRRYLVAPIDGLPQILMELDGQDPNIIKKSYVYVDYLPLLQYDGDPNSYDTPMYAYIHDRLGSVRMVMDALKNVVHRYTLKPFGETISAQSDSAVNAPDNPFMFTGQYYDEELKQYYLRARQYDPRLARFLSFDPVRGKYQESLTLHKYIYSLNDPINRIDLNGRFSALSFGFGVALGAGFGAVNALASGKRGLDLLWPIAKGALTGGGASLFGMGVVAKMGANALAGAVTGIGASSINLLLTGAGQRAGIDQLNLEHSLADFGTNIIFGAFGGWWVGSGTQGQIGDWMAGVFFPAIFDQLTDTSINMWNDQVLPELLE